MKNVIELIRVSTEKQARDDRAGIPAQREANCRTARAYGLSIVRTIEIVDVSGTAVLRSPEMQELLRLMESPDIHGVVTKEFSRLIRPEKFTDYAMLQQFIDTQTVLYLPDGPIDLASKSGRLLGTVRAAIAGMERQEIVSRMQDAKESMRRAGKHTGGESSLPYGVGYTREKGWFYTAEAEKVRHAFALFLLGETSYTQIGRQLNIPRTNVRYILENPIYTGWRVYDEKRDPSPLGYVPRPDGRQGHRQKMRRPPDEIICAKVLDELVSETEFSKVQEVIELKRHKHWRSHENTTHRYTYNGFVICGDCNSPLYTHTSNDEYYQCKSAHPRERRKRNLVGLPRCGNRYMLRKKLEPKLDILIGEKLRDSDFLQRVVDDYSEIQDVKSTPKAKPEQGLAEKLGALIEKRHRVLEAFFEGVITKEERDRNIADIDREKITFQSLLVESVPRAVHHSMDEILMALEPLAEWEFLQREEKRALLRVICPEISVFRYTVKSLVVSLRTETAGGNEVGHLKTAPSRFRAPRHP
jgi:DNA invertase Pin-like site-specific DNA recombinase